MKILRFIGLMAILCVIIGISSDQPFSFAKIRNPINRITVDTNGFEINKNGAFGFSLDTRSGRFDFELKDNNILHIVTKRVKSCFHFADKNLKWISDSVENTKLYIVRQMKTFMQSVVNLIHPNPSETSKCFAWV